MAIITKELAQRIVRKLKAEVHKRGKAHDIAVVYHEGKMVANFGIRRGSNRNLPHDHIPEVIFLRPNEARLLAQCPLSREQWIKIISKKGKL